VRQIRSFAGAKAQSLRAFRRPHRSFPFIGHFWVEVFKRVLKHRWIPWLYSVVITMNPSNSPVLLFQRSGPSFFARLDVAGWLFIREGQRIVAQVGDLKFFVTALAGEVG
jgi:hypothetical protein